MYTLEEEEKSVINNGRSIFRGPLRSSTMHNDVCVHIQIMLKE